MLVLHFTDRGKLQKASILTYLLAKERVVQIPPGEFGFHIFYALCHAAADVAKSRSSSGSFCSSSTIRSGRERQEETEEEEERCRKEEKEIRDLLPQLHLKGGCLEAFQILSHPSAKQLKKDQDKNTKREELERKGKKNNEGEEEKEEERAHQQDEVTGKESPSHSHTRRENKREDSCPTPSTVTTPWRDLRHIIQSMGVMGIDARTRALVFKILAAILHLGNLSFRGGERARREDRRGLELREEEQEEEADGDGIRRKRRKVRSGAEKSQRDDTSREDHGGKRKEEEEGEEEEQSEQEKEEEEKGDKKTKESDDCHKALELTEECKESLRAAAQLLGVCGGGEEGEEKLRLALVSRSVRETRSYLNREGALAARNATCKALYSRVFDCVVSKINASLAAGSKQELHRPRPLSSSFSSLSPSESSLLELSKGVKEKHQQTTHVESSFLPGNEEEENKRTEEEKKMKSLFCQKTKFSPFSRGTSRPSPPTSATSAEDFPCLQEKEKKRSGEGEEGSYSIGILDIFGFEDLASHSNSNRLEQLCINYANEKLHCFFLQQLLLNEKCLYIQEGLIHPLSFSSSSSSSFISTASSSVLFSPVKHVDRSPSSPFSLSLHSLSSTFSLSQSSLSFLPSLSNKRHHLSSSFSRASLFSSSSQGNESWRNGGDLLILRSAILCCLIGGVSSASHVSFLSEGLLDKSRQLLLPLDQSSSSSSSQERKEQSHYSRGGEERGGVAGERQAEESFYLQSYVSMKHLLHSLIQKKTPGLFQLLDEVSKLPLKQGGNRDVFFYQKLLTEMKNRGVDDLFIRPGGERKNHRQHHQQPRDLSSPSAGGLRFTVSHFACDVSYDVRDFCRSNSDILSDEIEQLFLSSSTYTELMRGGGEGEKEEEEEDGNNRKLTPSSSPSSCGSLPPTSIRTWRLQKSSTGMSSCLVSQRKSSLSVNFASQLQLILKGLQQTSCHYIRCIKPNLQQRAGVFDEAYVLHQLKCSGLVDLLHVMAVGYACRVSYEDLWKRYEAYLPSTLRHT
ncbi:myosin k, partial [Cystoisospora suis]